MPGELLVAQNLSAKRIHADGIVERIKELSFGFKGATFYRLTGLNLSGKNLLLQLLGLLVQPDTGRLFVEGNLATGTEEQELSEIRNQKFGFLFSAPFLLPSFTVLENVAMPLFKITQVEAREAKIITGQVMDLVGIAEFASKPVTGLPLLQQNLVALARAVIHHPKVLIIENLGTNLDVDEVECLLFAVAQIVKRQGLTVVATFASEKQTTHVDAVLELKNGSVVSPRSSNG